MNLNYAIWNQFRITFVYDEQTSIYQGASWTDARAEIRRLLATDFKRYGTISDAFGNCFIVNGSRIKSVTYSENTFQMLIHKMNKVRKSIKKWNLLKKLKNFY